MAQFNVFWPYEPLHRGNVTSTQLSTWMSLSLFGNGYTNADNTLGPYPHAMQTVNNARVYLKTPLNSDVANSELLVWVSSRNDQGPFLMFRQTASTAIDSGLIVALNVGAIQVQQRNSSFQTANIGASESTTGLPANTPYFVRARLSGDTLSVKFWTEQAAEPSGWNFTRTYTQNSTGRTGIGKNASGLVIFSDFSMGTAGDSAPALFGEISGQVRFANNAGAGSRIVRAVGRTVSTRSYETTADSSGNYTLRVRVGQDYTVYAMDNSLNRAIADRITPV